MTPTEIRNLIAKKIEGQGSAIDIGNGLPAILNGLVELVENAAPKIITSDKNWDEVTSGEYNTKALFASALGIQESDVDNLPSCDELKLFASSMSLKRVFAYSSDDDYIVQFGGTDGNYGFVISIDTFNGVYNLLKNET